MKSKFWTKIFCAVIIIILFTCIGLTNGKERKVTAIETLISNIICAPQKLFVYARNFIIKDNTFFSSIDELKNQNDELKNKNKELEEKMTDYSILESENKTLKEHMKMVDTYPSYNIVVADIISDSISNWEEVYIINKGSKNGIKEKMPVICGDGLVGYVLTVSETTSKIISILDAGNAVSSRVTKTRDAVVCKGSNELKHKNQLKLTYIPIGVELSEGDKIETSGMGGIYPKGIAIGEVKDFTIKQNPSENEATVETYVDFNKLETVAVVMGEN